MKITLMSGAGCTEVGGDFARLSTGQSARTDAGGIHAGAILFPLELPDRYVDDERWKRRERALCHGRDIRCSLYQCPGGLQGYQRVPPTGGAGHRLHLPHNTSRGWLQSPRRCDGLLAEGISVEGDQSRSMDPESYREPQKDITQWMEAGLPGCCRQNRRRTETTEPESMYRSTEEAWMLARNAPLRQPVNLPG